MTSWALHSLNRTLFVPTGKGSASTCTAYQSNEQDSDSKDPHFRTVHLQIPIPSLLLHSSFPCPFLTVVPEAPAPITAHSVKQASPATLQRGHIFTAWWHSRDWTVAFLALFVVQLPCLWEETGHAEQRVVVSPSAGPERNLMGELQGFALKEAGHIEVRLRMPCDIYNRQEGMSYSAPHFY